MLARFGELALRSERLDEILTEACRLVGEAFGTDLAKVMELQADGRELLVRAGVGWTPGVVGQVRIAAAEDTSEAHALATGKPTISPDIDLETRFRYPDILVAHGVKAVVNVVIIGAEGKVPFGLLQVDSRVKRPFTDDDTLFLRSYANIIAAAVERLSTIVDLRDAQAHLRRGIDQREVALDTGLIGFFEWDVERTSLKGDRRFAAFFGLDPDAVGRGLRLEVYLDRLHPSDRAGMRVVDGDGLRRGQDYVRQVRLALAGGEIRWLLVRGRAAALEDGASLTVIGTAVDISASKAADLRLRQSEERFRGFAENSSDTLWIADAEGRGLDYLSPAFSRMFGASREAMLSDVGRWGDLAHPGDRDAARRSAARVLAGEATAIEHYRVIRPLDGALRWIRDTAFAIRDEDGARLHVAGVAQDITDIAQAQAELAGSEQRFRTLVETVPLFVWRAGAQGWTWSSPQWQGYTGQAPERSRGWGWLAALHPEDRTRVRAAFLATDPPGGLACEHRIRRASDGAYRWHQARCVPVRGAPDVDNPHGAVVEWLGTTTDIDDLKRLQGQQQVLLAELQHRTRNLLAVVRSIASRSFGSLPQRRDFDTRLAAIGRVQGFLSRKRGWSVSIEELIRAELDAHIDGDPERVSLSGPALDLPGTIVQPFALALHELSTNAVKYGAFVQSKGRLSVAWAVERGAGEARVVLDWRERGVAIPEQPLRQGYGRELIERALPYQLRAETHLVFTPDGVHCRLAVPIVGEEPEAR